MKGILVFGITLAAIPGATAADFARDPSKPGQRVENPIVDSTGKAIGKATFVSTPAGVKVTVQAHDLPPGLHGIHVHESGVCDPGKNFASSGGHFAPEQKGHGSLSKSGPHGGDLPNLRVQADGTAQLEATLKDVSLNPADENSLLQDSGTALVIHAGPDDLATHPAGKSGDRIACAIIAAPASGKG